LDAIDVTYFDVVGCWEKALTVQKLMMICRYQVYGRLARNFLIGGEFSPKTADLNALNHQN